MRFFVFSLVAIAALATSGTAGANSWTVAPPGSQRSKDIKSENILDRPNRVLHFYGDAVRFANRRRSS
jgi:hypothetical protein